MVGLVFLIACSCGDSVPAPIIDAGLRCPNCSPVQVFRVIDGDTFDSLRGRIRLFGVDTPEVGEKCHDGARKRLKELAGVEVRLGSGPRAQDPGGRLLFYVYTEAGDSISEALIKEGWGYAWTLDGQHRDFLVEVETDARRQGVGCLW